MCDGFLFNLKYLICTLSHKGYNQKIDVVNVVHRLARDVDVAKRRC